MARVARRSDNEAAAPTAIGHPAGHPPARATALCHAVAESLAAIRWQPLTGTRYEDVDGHLASTTSYRGYGGRRVELLAFVSRRSSAAFLRRSYLRVDPDLPETLCGFNSYVYAVPEPGVLARRRQVGVLGKEVRRQAVEPHGPPRCLHARRRLAQPGRH